MVTIVRGLLVVNFEMIFFILAKQKDPLQILGERIRLARKKVGLSQEALAFEAGLDRSYVGGIERGERNPSFNTLCLLAKVVHVDLSDLTKGLPHSVKS